MNIFRWFRLLLLNLYMQGYSLAEQLQVLFRYYGNREFGKVDRALLKHYLFRNPFRLAKNYLQEKGAEDIYAYGETPLTTWEAIVKECGITVDDTVLELGCGRGRLCLWLHYFVGCKVIGIEEVPEFIEVANRLGVEGVTFICGDYLTDELPNVSTIYLYGTNLDDATILKLIPKLKQMGSGTKVITVSYPLSDYDDAFTLQKQFLARFPWGTAEVYLTNVS